MKSIIVFFVFYSIKLALFISPAIYKPVEEKEKLAAPYKGLKCK